MHTGSESDVLVYADYVCPFCYLGYASFDRYRDRREDVGTADTTDATDTVDTAATVDAAWHPFDLRAQQRRPDGSLDQSVDDGKDEAYFEQAKQNVERLAERYDVELAQLIATDVDSYDAQRVAWRAIEDAPDAFESFHRGVFDALWEDGRDIGERDVLEDIAADAGLPEEFVDETLADESTAESVETAFTAAQKRGITGVPTFVTGERAARGAVPPEQLRRLIDGT